MGMVASRHQEGYPRRDSRLVEAGDTFVAIAAEPARSQHIAQAVERGARRVVAAAPAPELPDGVSVELVDDPARAFARRSALAHGLPRPTPLVGVTGTDGKSSVAHVAAHCLGPQAGCIGSLGLRVGAEEQPGTHTTPPPEVIHAFLAGVPEDCPGVAIEVSSHAGDQGRLEGLPLRALAFTNLGHDHLDYHGTMRAYLAAKVRICEHLAPGAWLVVNADDAHSPDFVRAAEERGARVIELGHRRGDARLRQNGSTWSLVLGEAVHPLPAWSPGPFNAWNAAAGLLMVHAAGVPLARGLDRLASCPPVPGRMERLASGPSTYVDYACTPQAIERVVQVLRGEYPGQRLVVVFGCGGDRDRVKRGPMGQAALAADAAVLTNDNPRSEAPEAIVADVLAACPEDAAIEVVLDRGEAIRRARELAGVDGVVAVLGKGHETTQTIGDQVLPWDDRAVVRGLA